MAQNVQWEKSIRLAGLRRFAAAITILNVLGHTVLGFEQSWAQPLVAVAAAYALEILLEAVSCWASRRPSAFAQGPVACIDFLLSAHITGLAVSMLLYGNDQLAPIAFAAAVAIGSKKIFTLPAGVGPRHFLNPSNFGITLTLLLFPWIGIAPPYQFTENLTGAADWALPAIIICSGTFLNARFTKRLPLIAAWLGGFALQAVLRSVTFDTPLAAALNPMTGVAFLLYTFYMATDPATTPNAPRAQIAFGLSVAIVYGLLVVSHIVFGLFFALTLVCIGRGAGLYAVAAFARRRSKVFPPAMATEERA